MRYRWLLLDVDGTILDYDAAEEAALQATLRDADVPATPEVLDGYRRINAAWWLALEEGRTTPEELRVARWRELLEAHGADGIDPAQLARRYIGHLAEAAHVLEGAVEAVADLATRHHIALLTNGLADVQRPRLAASGVDRHAEVVVISDEVGAAKPDAAIFDAAFEKMGSPDRREVLMVGDSLTSDIAGGEGYGLDTVWIASAEMELPGMVGPGGTTGPHRPTHRIPSLRDLHRIL